MLDPSFFRSFQELSMRITSGLVLASSLLLFAACDDDTRADTDSGLRDAGTLDTGAAGDPCAADEEPRSTVGCNGGILGAARAPNSFGGLCTPSADPATDPSGSCTDANAVCWGGGGEGICVTLCEPSAGTYVSTGGCPTGSRCFDLVEAGLCFPDCNTGADCASGRCDGEGSCVEPEGEPPPDGGVPATDGGVPADGGTPDGGTGS
jgi:hypothetical protein